ncbi:AAA family ATPase [Flavobacterium fluviale]|uniref:Rad50/SbcC-type AAA domain-containing protein n=1 Tax=Flavobacterium fluviale TaxID=2249356 RepID=A0A344LXK4_9FLAO|nr:AAA family ATPase [Flavobacterium fluviale]AXB58646.1 hypothetical protein HYN86_19480 [Flavobacterium fluviale]
MKEGFLISKLILTGSNLKPAEIEFKKGLNVISGPTSTGKSFIFDCLNYMLGGQTLERVPPEAKNYNSIYLEIEAKKKSYTLERSISGGQFNLYQKSYDKINECQPTVLLTKLKKGNDNNISTFFLGLCNLDNKAIRKNKTKGTKSSLSFRDLCHLCLISETEITKTQSPIFAQGGFQKTKELNVVKFLVTGKDDSSIITEPDEKIINFKKGKVEILDELIAKFTFDISNGKTVGVKLDSLDKTISFVKNEQDKLLKQFSIYDDQRKEYSKNIFEFEKKIETLQETLSRSELLNEYYSSDTKRLKSTIEAGSLLLENSENLNSCPYCDNEINSLSSNDEISKTILSCDKEIGKIIFLQDELKSSLLLLNKEKDELQTNLYFEKDLLDNVEILIEKNINSSLVDLKKELEFLYKKRDKVLEENFIKESIGKFTQYRSEISDTFENKEENVYDDLSTAVMNPISENIYKILEECNYSEISTISFSEKTNDFVIGSKNRNLSGKGERAITYATFVLALSEYLEKKEYKMGVPIFDSPLVTYKKPDSNGEGITEDLAMDFYRYCASKTSCPQVIIFENEEPPSDILKVIHHIKFTKKVGIGRFGFIPK